PDLKLLLQKHKKKIFIPLDVAYLDKGKRREASVHSLPVPSETLDIGNKTIGLYCKQIKRCRAIYFKGPMGVYDRRHFDLGTKKVLKAIASSRAFSMMGGGHSLSAAQKFIDLRKISFVSLAGGALLQYLSGKKLPGLQALDRAKKL
ncbi:phosphoglycerate kinase, partial [Candidatus Woesearchaeota archaeon]|nr:phosphoglycerate kinase [Candidatus Woesearchaeota archaeon]